MPQELGQFLKRYHKAFVQAVGDDAEKAKSRIASAWVADWKSRLGRPLEDPQEFREGFQSFLDNELCFADRSEVSMDKGRLEIDIGGCAICAGNDLLRQEGRDALCPLVPTGLFAVSRVHNRKASLDGVEKPGPVGYCKIKYNLEDKSG